MLSRLAAAVLFMLLLALSAEAKRVALVIGNNAYPNLPEFRQLQKAVNDARSMRDTLRDDLGFEVSFAEDADFRTMNNGFKKFEASVEPGDIVFLFFSGHGVSIGGENFLLPSDIPVPVQGEEQRLIGSSFGAEQLVLRLKKRGARAIFTVLDACRDDPFEAESGKAIGGPSGLTKMDAAEGVFILFAAGVRQTALDRLHDADENPNSLFTRSLIPALKTGGLSQVDLAKRVYKEVKAAAATIGHEQTPAYYDQIDGYVTLKEGEALAPPAVDSIAADFELARTLNSHAGWVLFLDRHGNSGDMRVDVAKQEKGKLALLQVLNDDDSKGDKLQNSADVNQCDLLASVEADASKGINAVALADIDSKSAIPACLKALAESPRETRYMVQLARALQNDKQDEEALALFVDAAKAGSVFAMASAGIMFDRGLGTKVDAAKAADFYRQAADGGNLDSKVYLGLLMVSGRGVAQDFDGARKLFRTAAEAGVPGGMHNLAVLMANNATSQADSQEAVNWMRKAAEAGYADSLVGLGGFYVEGRYVQQDYAEAANLYRKAVTLGNSDGMFYLGLLHSNGLGTPQNHAEAFAWFRKSADAGGIRAYASVGWYYGNGVAVPKDDGEAAKWYQKSADAGDPAGMNNIGVAYQQGWGVKANAKTAIKWFRKAAELGFIDSAVNLGTAYELGTGVKADAAEAAKWYHQAALGGQTQGMQKLAVLLREGRGVKKNIAEAEAWEKKATTASGAAQ